MKRILILSAFLGAITLNAQTGNTGINTTSPKATLDVNLPTTYANGQLAGIAVPQLRGDQIEAMSTTGLKEGTFVYATSSSSAIIKDITAVGYWYWKNATDKWEPLIVGTSAGGNTNGWNLDGNAGTTAANYLGTKDAQPLNFKTNAAADASIKMTITSSGNMGIGTASPGQKLDVNGNAITNYLFVRPQNTTIEGGEIQLQGSGSYPAVQIDNYSGYARVFGQTGMQVLSGLQISSLPSGTTDENVLTADASGNLHKIGTAKSLSSSAEPWQVIDGTTKATANDENIYQMGNVAIGKSSSSGYKLDVNGDVINNGWYRSRGSTGWYSETYQGGWYMSDGTWIRTYNDKNVWTGGGLLGTNGGLTAGYGGATPPAGGAIIAGSVGIGTASPGTKLDVVGAGRFSDQTQISRDGSGPYLSNYTLSLSEATSSTGKLARIQFHNSGAQEGYVALSADAPRRMIFNDNQGAGLGIEVNGTAQIKNLPTGAAGDKVVVADTSGNLKVSAAMSSGGFGGTGGYDWLDGNIRTIASLGPYGIYTATATPDDYIILYNPLPDTYGGSNVQPQLYLPDASAYKNKIYIVMTSLQSPGLKFYSTISGINYTFAYPQSWSNGQLFFVKSDGVRWVIFLRSTIATTNVSGYVGPNP